MEMIGLRRIVYSVAKRPQNCGTSGRKTGMIVWGEECDEKPFSLLYTKKSSYILPEQDVNQRHTCRAISPYPSNLVRIAMVSSRVAADVIR